MIHSPRLALALLLACASCSSPSTGAAGSGDDTTTSPATSGQDPAAAYPATPQALGVQMPPDTRQVSETPTIGNEGVSENTVVLLTATDETAARAHFSALPGSSPAANGCVSVNGVQACVFPPADVPRYAGGRAAPPWARAWIRLYTHGEPDPCPPCPAVMPGCSCPAE